MAEETEPAPVNDKKFTQAELDRIVQERLAREQEKYKGYDDLKAKAAKLDELESATASETVKLTSQAEKAERERDEAKQAAEQATEAARKTTLRSEIIAAAAAGGAIDPAEVHTLLEAGKFEVADGDKKITVTIGDDGQVTGAKEAVTAFLAAKKHLVGSTPDPGPGGGGARGGAPNLNLDQQITEAEDKGDWSTAGQLKAQKLAASASTT